VRSAFGQPSFGEKLRGRRRTLGLSQLRLALEAGVSARHLSFIESGRSQPSREMVLRLAQQLRVPLREQNAFLLAAGFAPAFEQRALDAPELAAVREAAALVLANHEPFPAVALDRRRDVVMSNRAGAHLVESVAPELLAPTTNIYRVLLHPRGLASRIVGFAEYSSHLLARLQRDAEVSADGELGALLAEVERYPGVGSVNQATPSNATAFLTLRVRDEAGELAFVTTLATFGTPFDVTVSELIIESLFPANAFTAKRLREISAAREPKEWPPAITSEGSARRDRRT
jgi:transcriptional regulator with XRE-family HTH domain